LTSIAGALKQAAQTVSMAEEAAKAIHAKETVSGEQMQEAVAKAEAVTERAKEHLERAQQETKEVSDGADGDMEEVKMLVTREVARIRTSAAEIQGNLAKVVARVAAARMQAVRKALSELETLRAATLGAVRDQMNADGKTAQDLFVDIGGAGGLGCKGFVEFVGKLPELTLEDGECEKLFAHIAGSRETISEEQFLEFLRLYFKVAKPTVLTETMSIKSKTLRRLEIGEVVEAIEGPKKEEEVGVQRVKCRAANDSIVGWVTVAGNQGTIFLEPGGSRMACVKETVFTDGLSAKDSATIRPIAPGEIIKILEFDKKDKSTDVMRIKGESMLDGVTGWITVAGSQGTIFLESC